MDPTNVASIGQVGEKFGFPAMLVVILLAGFYVFFRDARQERKEREADIKAEREARDKRDEERERERREERERRDKAHLDALAMHSASVNGLGQAVMENGRKLDRLIDEQREATTQLKLVAKG